MDMTLERCFNEEYRLTSIDSIRLCTRSLFRWFISWYFEPFVTVFYKKCTALKIPSVPFLFFFFLFSFFVCIRCSIDFEQRFECVKNVGPEEEIVRLFQLFYFRNMIVTFFSFERGFYSWKRYMPIFRYLRSWTFSFSFLFKNTTVDRVRKFKYA